MPKPQSSDGGDDARFRTMHSAPTFNTSRKESKKVKLDGRFEGVLTESRFRVAPGSVDRYGRKTRKTGQASKDLEQFYEIDRDDPNIHDKNMDKDKSLKKQSNEDRMDYLNRLSRGELQESDSESSSDSSQEDESDSDNSSDVNLDSNERETAKQSVLDIPQEEEEVPTGDSTTRLAILHCDWDNIKSDDLLVVLQSFCPTNGSILSVTVYPSDYGIEQMAQEEKFGPQGIWTNADKDTNAVNHSSDPSNSDGNSCEEDDVSESKSGSIDESESEQDVYDDVVGDLESAEESKAHGENDTQSLRKLSKGADFERKGNTAGLVSIAL